MAKVYKEHLDWAEGQTREDGRPFPEWWGFYCPGCMAHQIVQGRDEETARELSLHMLNVRDVHKFNGDPERPMFSPSLMYNFVVGYVCHSYVENGQIRFLDDCTHPLRGQTIPLPELHSK